MYSYEDLTGRKFGKLTVLSKADDSMNFKVSKWNCICDCGKLCVRGSRTLRKYDNSSCGCGLNEVVWKTRRERYGSFAKTSLPEYKTWQRIKQRCNNPSNVKFKDYGGRGITVCSRWLESFDNFYEDMGSMPTSEYSIERKNVNGNYDPDNCCWATWEEQCRNKRVFNPNGVPGVYWDKSRNRYRVIINADHKNITVGRFETIDEAVEARKQAELKYWGKSS